MTHGSGGRAMAQLIDELFARAFDNEWLRQGNDQAAFAAPAGRMVMATDSHVVSPLFFPGGDIGCLSVHGTINDVAMSGATPLYLAAGFVLEEGFPLADLKRIVESMAAAAREAGVPVVTGDTKVVEKGKGDGVFITTTGVGVVPAGVELSGDRARPGDAILVSGMLGDHGVAIMSLRENLSFETTIESDTAALHGLVAAMLPAAPGLRALRDPTRGGLATTLNELARQSGCGMVIREAALPVRPQVAAACEFLGLDPLYVANEGKLVAICAPADAAPLLAAMRAHPLGRDAAIIGILHRRPAPLRADGHELRRTARRRLAHRRAAAADLLSGVARAGLPPFCPTRPRPRARPTPLQHPPRATPGRHMRLLLLCHAFNSLTQRLWVELNARRPRRLGRVRRQRRGHRGGGRRCGGPTRSSRRTCGAGSPRASGGGIRCLVVHPGIVGDRGPSALDWALHEGVAEWGVTVLRANAEMDAGDVYATARFPLRAATKSSVYRNEVTEAAVAAVREALAKLAAGIAPTPPAAWPPARDATPAVTAEPATPASHATSHLAREARRAASGDRSPPDRRCPGRAGSAAPADDAGRPRAGLDLRRHRDGPAPPSRRRRLPRRPRRSCWECRCCCSTRTPTRRRAACPARSSAATTARSCAPRSTAPCGSATSGAGTTPMRSSCPRRRCWATASTACPRCRRRRCPATPGRPSATRSTATSACCTSRSTTGPSSTAQCEALRAAFLAATARPVRVLVLAGGPDFWSNGIHLNAIEAAAEPADESWRNINAMNDLVHAIVTADRQLTVAALQGNGGAGGVFLALAADRVWARDGVRAESALQGHGQPLRLRVLDLPAAAARDTGAGGGGDAGTAAGRGDRGEGDGPDRRPLRPRSGGVPGRSRSTGRRRWRPIPDSPPRWPTATRAAPPTRP